MCDTLCAIGRGRALFAKNSDRPPTEAQPVQAFPRRPAGGAVRTQYLTLDDPGAVAVLGSRPDWLWGFEHGVNEHGVAIGNEAVSTVDDPASADPALIGMDLVRLGLERAVTAEAAVAVMGDLLEHYGQGGIANEIQGVSYFSSFIVADPREAWILETSGSTWAAKRVDDAAAISNRLTLRDDWDRASRDLSPGTDFDTYRDPETDTAFADVRLDASLACLATGAPDLGPRDLAAHLRHHGDGSWGRPGATDGTSPIPEAAVTVCMHVRSLANTTSAIVCELPQDPGGSVRSWVALGSPCCSVFVPAFGTEGLPAELGETRVWERFAVLRDRAEADPEALEAIRSVLDPLEAELWDEADATAGDPGAEERFTASIWPWVAEALDRLS